MWTLEGGLCVLWTLLGDLCRHLKVIIVDCGHLKVVCVDTFEGFLCQCVKVFCGRIPKEVFEDELIPLFEKCGTIWDLRLMMDPMSGYNRSFCFVTFTDRGGAGEAVKQVTNYSVVLLRSRCVQLISIVWSDAQTDANTS